MAPPLMRGRGGRGQRALSLPRSPRMRPGRGRPRARRSQGALVSRTWHHGRVRPTSHGLPCSSPARAATLLEELVLGTSAAILSCLTARMALPPRGKSQAWAGCLASRRNPRTQNPAQGCRSPAEPRRAGQGPLLLPPVRPWILSLPRAVLGRTAGRPAETGPRGAAGEPRWRSHRAIPAREPLRRRRPRRNPRWVPSPAREQELLPTAEMTRGCARLQPLPRLLRRARAAQAAAALPRPAGGNACGALPRKGTRTPTPRSASRWQPSPSAAAHPPVWAAR
mmetsp:Transcript_31310/g.74414  ORF Transcript_31310/g.74414 Transcript_31310/m.74414 type:complete len:281 (+) Transcript_31310:1237-2079(+)